MSYINFDYYSFGVVIMSEGDKYIALGKFLNLPRRLRVAILSTIDSLIESKLDDN